MCIAHTTSSWGHWADEKMAPQNLKNDNSNDLPMYWG